MGKVKLPTLSQHPSVFVFLKTSTDVLSSTSPCWSFLNEYLDVGDVEERNLVNISRKTEAFRC